MSTLSYRITNVQEMNRKLNSKKKVKGFKSAKDFKASTFNAALNEKGHSTIPSVEAMSAQQQCDHREIPMSPNEIETPLPSPSVLSAQQQSDHREIPMSREVPKSQNKTEIPSPSPYVNMSAKQECKKTDEEKSLNLTLHKIVKKQKELKSLQNLIETEKDNLKSMNAIKGHYSIRNIEKRDSRAQKTRQDLREANMTIFMQDKMLKQHQTTERKLRRVIKKLKNELSLTNRDSETARRSILNSEDHVQQLILENESLKEKLNRQGTFSLKQKQSVNYFKRNLNKLKIRVKSNDTIKQLQKDVKDKDLEIKHLLSIKETLEEKLQDHSNPRNCDGSFNENVRLCVIELAGLEVAVEKVSKVIQCVSRHMFLKDLSMNDLPSKSTTQTIVDEGHFIAKKFIASKIETSESFGINRDGTTRKKQKILDTSVTLDSGEIMSLGFTRVAHETAKTIHAVTQHHVKEMSDIQGSEDCDDYIRTTLEKLSFTMCDRASNEKAADRLLDEWRDSVLEERPENDKKKVKHFHCMAHVLLGFHKYSCDDIKKFERDLIESDGPLGRDSLGQFKNWNKGNTVTERVVRTCSDIFAPAGDHHGLRDRWEAHCCEHQTKSLISNYKDNRFNGIYKTAAEIVHHFDDMIEVLSTVSHPNRKLVAVKADMLSPTIQTILHCFGLFYLRVTGPYWNFVTSGLVPYLKLYSHIQSLANYLNRCILQPDTLLNPDYSWECEDVTGVPNQKLLEDKLCKEAVNTELMLELIKLMSGSMLRCINKQLSDFLPGGQFGSKPDPEDLKSTCYAQSTNLGCEHHFGDLDSSQKRRPNASMHHHSSIQLLKRNGKSMMKWLSNMTPSDRSKVMKDARKGGLTLRQSHLNCEKSVLKEIHNDMMNEKNKKTKKRKRNQTNTEIEDEFEQINETSSEDFVINEYVAIAYQEGWYPGVIEKNSDDCLHVNFMTPTRQPGVFTWPARKDKQQVSFEFVLKHGFVPECRNSGRLWYISCHDEINSTFNKYSKTFF